MHCYSTSICLQCSVKWEEIFFSTSLRCHLLLQCKSLQWVFSGNAVCVLSGQSKMCILANTGRHPPSVFINKVTGLAEYWSLAKTLLTQHFNCFAAASAATAGLLSRMEECFGAKQKFSIRSFLHTGKLWGWGVTMTTPNAQPTWRYLWMRTTILWFRVFLKPTDGDMGDQIYSVCPGSCAWTIWCKFGGKNARTPNKYWMQPRCPDYAA